MGLKVKVDWAQEHPDLLRRSPLLRKADPELKNQNISIYNFETLIIPGALAEGHANWHANWPEPACHNEAILCDVDASSKHHPGPDKASACMQ